MLVTTIGALLWQAYGAMTAETGPKWFLSGICSLLIVLAAAVLAEAWPSLRARTQSQAP